MNEGYLMNKSSVNVIRKWCLKLCCLTQFSLISYRCSTCSLTYVKILSEFLPLVIRHYLTNLTHFSSYTFLIQRVNLQTPLGAVNSHSRSSMPSFPSVKRMPAALSRSCFPPPKKTLCFRFKMVENFQTKKRLCRNGNTCTLKHSQATFKGREMKDSQKMEFGERG